MVTKCSRTVVPFLAFGFGVVTLAACLIGGIALIVAGCANGTLLLVPVGAIVIALTFSAAAWVGYHGGDWLP